MKDIYIVTSGTYSDYGILAVFTKRPLADRFVQLYNGNSHKYDSAEIEVWPADKCFTKQGALWEYTYRQIDGLEFVEITTRDEVDEYEPDISKYGFMVYIRAQTKEQATKIGRDLRMKTMAEKLEL